MPKLAIPQGTFVSGEVFAKVARCGCGDPDSHSKLNLPCPRPREVDDQGLIARVDGSEIRAFEVEVEPTLSELLWEFFRALGQLLKNVFVRG